ncbi:MAG TPA: hypothetical protein VFT76_00100 [Actinomycetota bacterium]|nr:hypothetical protein [Actinomycetota bacterium]
MSRPPLRVAKPPDPSKAIRLLADVLRSPWLELDLARIARTDACAFLGHIPKVQLPAAEKRESERGCVCGARDWI